MFNIVRRRDLMLGQSLSTKQEAEKLCDEYGGDYIVIHTGGVPGERSNAVQPARQDTFQKKHPLIERRV